MRGPAGVSALPASRLQRACTSSRGPLPDRVSTSTPQRFRDHSATRFCRASTSSSLALRKCRRRPLRTSLRATPTCDHILGAFAAVMDRHAMDSLDTGASSVTAEQPSSSPIDVPADPQSSENSAMAQDRLDATVTSQRVACITSADSADSGDDVDDDSSCDAAAESDDDMDKDDTNFLPRRAPRRSIGAAKRPCPESTRSHIHRRRVASAGPNLSSATSGSASTLPAHVSSSPLCGWDGCGAACGSQGQLMEHCSREHLCGPAPRGGWRCKWSDCTLSSRRFYRLTQVSLCMWRRVAGESDFLLP
jgi:hypothetical protein